ncbi:HTH domain-containing protein [Methylococcus sp. Mc7]|uniref:HVO_A0114 family putative DNA-binding protein n=1 Tax=Methylococcus sp. Mc7 TaxID=2860258 RepID=UPI001C532BAD|nr:HTH domain-containing protein [Methylococcus sp. Mc7]QXP85665.1 HTH domain-containing protein [Methylococcus sp. Mc7]
MKTLTIKTATEDDFFKRGRTLARFADNAEALPEEYVISFEDPADVLKLLSTARLALLKAIKEQPGSINALAKRLHRDRSAVKRDTDVLEKAGIVTVESKVLPGHGRMKEVRVSAQKLRLEAEFA